MMALLFCGAMAGCTRETIMPVPERPVRGETDEDLLKDSVYVYTYTFYLWQDELPSSFPTRSYTSAEAVLETLKTYATDAQGDPYDRFSFLDRTGTIDAEIQQGMTGSFGLDVRYNNDTDLYVKKVDGDSPADAAGIKRGWQILEINGNSNLALANLEQDNFAFLFDALAGQTISLRLRRPDGEQVNVNLNRAGYRIQPILADEVYTVGAKKIGYFAFDSFVSTSDLNDNPTYVRTQLNQLFTQFEQQGISELIVDLRYNGGGAVITADYLSNMLAPASVGTGLMYSYKINDMLTSLGWGELFSPEYFNKTNNLNLQRVYFLVTESTASASELLINNLRPHMEVKLIGEHNTYGKPVGYFAWDILGVDLYAISFQTFNSTGFGDYFSGLPVDKVAYDDLTRDFGDMQESMIAEALYYARTGGFSATALDLQMNTRTRRSGIAVSDLNRALDRHAAKGMYSFKKGKELPVK